MEPYLDMKFKMKKRFILFLKEKEVYIKYRTNLERFKWGNSHFYGLPQCEIDGRMVFNSFPWMKTPEGFDFWLNISYEWEYEWVEIKHQYRKKTRNDN